MAFSINFSSDPLLELLFYICESTAFCVCIGQTFHLHNADYLYLHYLPAEYFSKVIKYVGVSIPTYFFYVFSFIDLCSSTSWLNWLETYSKLFRNSWMLGCYKDIPSE